MIPARTADPSRAVVRRWRRYLANERAEAATYHHLATRRGGEEHEILLELAAAETRHQEHWLALLGGRANQTVRADVRTRLLAALARRFGSVFVLALVQGAESRSPYVNDPDATSRMAADEQVHEEVVRALAERGRIRLSGTFRAAVFGANDGLVSNLSLVLGVGASGVGAHVILLTGVAGLLAGALSMGAGEYVSVHSQRELLAASAPNPHLHRVFPDLDIEANELALFYRSRGMDPKRARSHARAVLSGHATDDDAPPNSARDHEAIGTGMGAATSSFCFFASGAIIPVLPYAAGLSGITAVLVASALVGAALLVTGAVVGLLSGAPVVKRALRQLAIGFGAAAVTFLLGSLFGAQAG